MDPWPISGWIPATSSPALSPLTISITFMILFNFPVMKKSIPFGTMTFNRIYTIGFPTTDGIQTNNRLILTLSRRTFNKDLSEPYMDLTFSYGVTNPKACSLSMNPIISPIALPMRNLSLVGPKYGG